MAPRRKSRDQDVRVIFDRLSDDALLDDFQVGLLAGRSPMTIKRWRRNRQTPPVVMLNGAPRFRVGDIRPWLRGPKESRPRRGTRAVETCRQVIANCSVSRLPLLSPAQTHDGS